MNTDEEIFQLAVGRQPAERDALLARACAGDAALRNRVEALLRAHDNPGSFMAASPVETLRAAAGPYRDGQPGEPPPGAGRPIAEGPGARVGPYKLLEQIGEGGMGVVFLAEQTRPVRRQVALKVVKAGMDTRQVVARFEAERQALAMMDHPNIARVLDAGATDTGRPYFVMDLVKGVPITRYCDEHRLTVRRRLELFVPVCRAVQHAHGKGVIHRDLKPSNVLIAPYDGVPVPKVIDFGVAKATGEPLTEKTMFTLFGAMLGTPQYMSPEQAELNQLDVDTRSDVYSLGILLYELLTGTTPLARAAPGCAAVLELLRVIREQDPPPPSTRLSGGDLLPTIAASRGVDPGKLHGLVRGELDWIVMKALEKDRARRYDTAHDLGRDVERYLAHEEVQACPPSAAYHFRKYARRHRATLATAGALAAVLVGATVVSAWLAVRATRAERLARTRLTAEADARRDSEASRGRAAAEAERAKAEAAVADAVIRYVNEDLLGRADPPVDPDARLALRAVVDRASERIGARFEGQPAVEAAIRHTVATTYAALGNFRQAETHTRRALELSRAQWGDDDPRVRAAETQLAWACYHQQHFDEADRLFEQVLDAHRRAKGDDDPATLEAMRNVGASYGMQPARLREAEPVLRRVFEGYRRRLGDGAEATVAAATSLANVRDNLGRHEEAEGLLRAAIAAAAERAPDTPDLTTRLAMTCLGNILSIRGKHDEALAVIDAALESQRRALGEQNSNTLHVRWVQCQALHRKGERRRACRVAEELLELRLRIQGADHAATRDTATFLAAAYARRAWDASARDPAAGGDHDAPPALARRAVDLDPASATGWRALGAAEYRAGNWRSAVDALEKSCVLDANPAGGDASQWSFLAMAHWKLNDHRLARAWYTAACLAGNADPDLRAEAARLLQVSEPWPPPDWQPGEADEQVYDRIVALNPQSTWPKQARLIARRNAAGR
jgi:serine/threonine protein kinase